MMKEVIGGYLKGGYQRRHDGIGWWDNMSNNNSNSNEHEGGR